MASGPRKTSENKQQYHARLKREERWIKERLRGRRYIHKHGALSPAQYRTRKR